MNGILVGKTSGSLVLCGFQSFATICVLLFLSESVWKKLDFQQWLQTKPVKKNAENDHGMISRFWSKTNLVMHLGQNKTKILNLNGWKMVGVYPTYVLQAGAFLAGAVFLFSHAPFHKKCICLLI